MKIISIKNPISFTYHSILKTVYKDGLLPTVTKDFYGSLLNPKNVTLEHILPKSKGGKSKLGNFALATNANNNARGNKPLSEVFNREIFEQYCEQFKGVKIPFFNGNNYIEQITRTIERLIKSGQ